MGTVNAAEFYPDGLKLDTAGHNQNIYTANPGIGIMSEPNGHLESVNLEAGFTIDTDHLTPESVHRARGESVTEKIDCNQGAFDRAESLGGAITSAPISEWVPVPGFGQRWYQHFAASAAILQIQFFLSPWHVNYWTTDDPDTLSTLERPDMAVCLAYNGALLNHTKRAVPVTAAYTNTPQSSYSAFDAHDYVAQSVMTWDLHHMATNLAVGWHDVQLMLYMEPVDISLNLWRQRGDTSVSPFSGKGGYETYSHDIRQRCSFGSGTVRVVPFL